MKDISCRKWQITINNPVEKGYTHENIVKVMNEFDSVKYWCMSDEVGESGTFHTHIYFYATGAVRKSTLDRRFVGGHFEKCKGTSQQNRDYVFKEGKWEDDKKGETNLRDSHFEFGEMPQEKQGKRRDLTALYEMIKDGMSDYEIIDACPQYLMNTDKIERVRQTVREEEFRDLWRTLEVTYIYGYTGTGKTRGVMERYGYRNVYRVTDYMHPFDAYKGQDVIVFEEFRSSLPISDMLKYLDGYPVELPCRYMNRQACFTKVYIISNIELTAQYENIQTKEHLTWEAFLRRIHDVHIYMHDKVFKMDLVSYFNDWKPVVSTPFDYEIFEGD